MAAGCERAPALVPDQIAAAAPHQAEAPGHGDLDWDAVLAQTGDLSVPLRSGQEENHDQNCQRPKADENENTTNTAAVHLHAGPTEDGDRPARCVDLPGGRSLGRRWLRSDHGPVHPQLPVRPPASGWPRAIPRS